MTLANGSTAALTPPPLPPASPDPRNERPTAADVKKVAGGTEIAERKNGFACPRCSRGKCPTCAGTRRRVRTVRVGKQVFQDPVVQRYRQCSACGHRFSTEECGEIKGEPGEQVLVRREYVIG